jgi:hypothetical protein
VQHAADVVAPPLVSFFDRAAADTPDGRIRRQQAIAFTQHIGKRSCIVVEQQDAVAVALDNAPVDRKAISPVAWINQIPDAEDDP